MCIVYFEQSISTACVVILFLIVIANTYDLILAYSINNDNRLNGILLIDEHDSQMCLIQLQTALSVFAILLYKEFTSIWVNVIKFWIFSPLLISLIFEMVSTIAILCYLNANHTTIGNNLEEMMNIDDQVKPTYIFLATVELFLHFVFKLCAAIIICKYTSQFVRRIRISNSDRMHLINDNDIGRNESHPPTPPPQYEQCVPDFTSPPSYSEVQKVLKIQRGSF